MECILALLLFLFFYVFNVGVVFFPLNSLLPDPLRATWPQVSSSPRTHHV